jgi:hypothetical protein
VMIEGAGAEGGEAGLDGEHVVAQSGSGTIEVDSVPAHNMGLHLCAETEAEATTGGFLEFPCGCCGDERATRKCDGNPRGQVETGSGDGGGPDVQICRSSGFGEEQTRETSVLGLLRVIRGFGERKWGGHDVDVHECRVDGASSADGRATDTSRN